MSPPKAKAAAPSGRALMTAQQKKDADIANVGQKAAAKAAAAAASGDAPVSKIDKDKIRAEAAAQRAIAEGGVKKADKGKKTDLSFLDAAIAPKKKGK